MKFAIFLLAFQVSAYAGTTTIYNLKDLAAIKAACLDPASVGNQLAPSEIKIFCGEKKTGWEEAAGGEVSLNTTDSVTSSAETNKPNAGAESETKLYPSAADKFTCAKYVQFQLAVSSARDSNCEEVATIEDLNQFCKDKIAADSDASSGSIWNKTFTGLSVDNCVSVQPVIGPTPNPVEGPGQGPGQDPVQQN